MSGGISGSSEDGVGFGVSMEQAPSSLRSPTPLEPDAGVDKRKLEDRFWVAVQLAKVRAFIQSFTQPQR